MKFNQKFTIGEKVKITDIDNYKGYTGYYDVPELQDEYLSNTVFTITDAEIRDLVDSPVELEDASEDVYQYELVDDKGHTLDLMIDSYALEKAEMFNKNKINELVNEFYELNLKYLDESSIDDVNESELPHSKETFQLYRSLFNELVKPVMKKIEIEHGENARIIFNYFAIENDKLFLAFYEPIFYVDLDDYLNNTENIIEKLVEETEK
ncbi:TPA: hypothetical protein I1827_000876 [Staphylococcus pseudintermedius]|uniref:hypothetical protein n=1 Tax=Staphylococcus pseudintermedius TaxID=283734 RepID=UPI0011239B69|nr:hypothetical protein [Staphylococcus pseudintermedius]EIQ3863882.1 hypothetical protein [Staphylococcus pseudintermedius]ELH1953171.1 hypothetical protein [Staphylococcus pseudintermedius]ELP8688136.1 hypothetical protein [Staphylococcus pseudintermedius]ELW0071169.1 hypothetical protein [Staphylococcus pseudintermedius]QDX56181.1 hypothetical protein DNI27_13280 [Staphylococcus pseudintermedius]